MYVCLCVLLYDCVLKKERKKDRKKERKKEIKKEKRQTDIQKDKHTDRRWEMKLEKWHPSELYFSSVQNLYSVTICDSISSDSQNVWYFQKTL